MAITLRFRRGTNKAQLDAYGPLQAGEPCILTEDGVVYIGDGTSNYMIGQVASGTGNPSGSGPPGRMYVDTAASGIWFYHEGAWMEVGNTISDLSQLSGTLDDIADGTSYQRVAASEVDSNGYIIQLNDGSYIVTASGAYEHINNDSLHRVINDLGVSSIELWSSQKIWDSISSVVNGIDWQESVLDKDLCEPPGSPTEGSRYLSCPTASGGWVGNYIYEYLTASGGWVQIPRSEGQATWVEDENVLYVWDGGTWINFSSVSTHNTLSGLQGGTTGEYYHLTNADYLALTTNRDETIQDIIGTTISGGTGIDVNYDDPTGIVTITLGAHSHTIAHGDLTGIGANDHHNQVHGIASSDHTVTAASGMVLGTVAANTLGMTYITDDMMANVSHSALQNVGENDHHNRLHDFTSTLDHSFGNLGGKAGNIYHINSGETALELTDTVDGGTLA